jgi:uncharacterized PurR-regulated membrane protein YhhQ (DUF165 family)
MQRRFNAPISIVATLSSQLDDIGRQSRFVISRLWFRTLCGAVLSQYGTAAQRKFATEPI